MGFSVLTATHYISHLVSIGCLLLAPKCLPGRAETSSWSQMILKRQRHLELSIGLSASV
jgi:hypothetical protein